VAVIGFVLPPFIFRSLGVEYYGIFSLLLLVGSFVQYLDMGVTTSLAQFVASTNVLGNLDRVSKVVLWVLMLYIVAIGFILLGWVVLQGWLVSFVFPGASMQGIAVLGLLFLLGASLDLLASVFASVIQGFQRYDQMIAGNIATQTSKAVISIIVLLSGGGIEGLAWIQIAAGTLRCFIMAALAIRDGLSIRSWVECRSVNKKDLFGLIRLSFGLQGAQVAGLASSQLVRILVVRVGGLEAAGIYDIANKLVLQIATLPDSVYIAISPAISRMDSLDDRVAIRQLISKSIRYLLIFGIPACLFASWFAPEIIRAWIGSTNPMFAYAIRVLVIGAFVNVLSGPAYHGLIGLGRPGLGLIKALVWLVMNSTVTIVLGVLYGFAGVLVGSTIALVSASIFLLVESERRYTFGISKVLLPNLPQSVIIAFLGVIASSITDNLIMAWAIPVNILTWGSIFSAYMAFCLICSWFIGLVKSEEKILLRTVAGTRLKRLGIYL
jgi:O-antigen/teichoic acid export membrane protein